MEWTLHGRTHRGSLSGDAVSHGYGLATASGERAWLCPQLPPLPKWLLPPPARGHPVSSRGRIERHGAHKVTEDRGRSRGLRREPVRGAACQSGMHQFVWCSGTHRVAWRSTMPETVALAILRFGSRCHRAIWINSHCWERSHLGRVAKGLGALARGPNQASVLCRSSAQGSQTFGFPPYAIVGRDDHFDWLSYKFAKASTHS